MKWTRRALLSLLPLTGCAISDPVVYRSGEPKRAPKTPELSQAQAAALNQEAQLAALFRIVRDQGAVWKLPAEVARWADGCLAAHSAHVARLRCADPLLPGDEPDFAEPKLEVATPKDWEAAKSEISTLAGAAADSHRSRALEAAGLEQPLALFHASLAASSLNSARPGVPPVAGQGSPKPFAPSSPTPSLGVVLTRCWALIYGLESGLGRLDKAQPEFVDGLERLTSAKELRDDLLGAPELAKPPEQLTSYAIGPINNAAEVKATWAALETDLLGAWGRAAAACTGERASSCLDGMQAQVVHVAHWGGALPHWPGWV